MPRPLNLHDVAVGIHIGDRDRGEQLFDGVEPLPLVVIRRTGVNRGLQAVAGSDKHLVVRAEPFSQLLGHDHPRLPVTAGHLGVRPD